MENLLVDQIRKSLQRQRTSKPSFKLPLTVEQAQDLLTQAVQNEVQWRGNRFINDTLMQGYILQAAQWLTAGRKFGLIIMGTTGNGKTTLMRAICRLVDLVGFRGGEGRALAFDIMTAKDVIRWRKEKTWEVFRERCTTPLLAIDDFGEEAVDVLDYGNVINPVVDLLSIRYNAMLPTIMTTNSSNDNIRRNYGDRIADRFNEMMQVIIFTNPSHRGKNY